MPDCVLIQHGRAHEIWRGQRKTDIPPMHPDLLAQVVQVESGGFNEGDVWDGESFSPAPPPDPRLALAAALKASDSDMARIAEDVIDAIIAKGVIARADLPARVREKLDARRALRAALSDGAT